MRVYLTKFRTFQSFILSDVPRLKEIFSHFISVLRKFGRNDEPFGYLACESGIRVQMRMHAYLSMVNEVFSILWIILVNVKEAFNH